jgi:hypothetical protein
MRSELAVLILLIIIFYPSNAGEVEDVENISEGKQEDAVNSMSAKAEAPLINYTLTCDLISIAGKGADASATSAYETVSYFVIIENVGTENLTGVKLYDSWDCVGDVKESVSSDGILQTGENWTYIGDYVITQEDLLVFNENFKYLTNSVRVIADNAESKRAEIKVPMNSKYTYTFPGTDCREVGADGHTILLINCNDAHDPTYSELLNFLRIDSTDTTSYKKGVYVCADYAEEVHNNAEAAGIKAAWVGINFTDSSISDHACNAFNTTDRGLIFIDCTTGDKEVKVVRGEQFTSESLFSLDEYLPLGVVQGIEVWW